MATIERHEFKIPIATEQDLRDYVWLAFGVVIPDVKVCPNHTTPWRAFADAYFTKHTVDIWKASRGFGGKSFLLSVLGMVEATTLKADVNILGGSGAQSSNVLKHMTRLWNFEDAPRDLLTGDVKQEMRFLWGNTVQALMASQTSVRGPHPQRLRIDEADECDIRIIDAALGQPMGKEGITAHTVLSSTHQNADGTMTELLKRAAQNNWGVYEWCWRETSAQPTGWLSDSEVERKRTEVTSAMWAVEYDLQEPSPESRAIYPSAIDKMFDLSLGEFEGTAREYIEIEPPWCTCNKCGYGQPIADGDECPNCKTEMTHARYATGADWARKQDWTVIITLRIDCNPIKLVTFERTGRLPYPVMVPRLDYVNKRYEAKSANDGTGLGDVVNGYLTTSSEAVLMIGRERHDLLSNCISAIERGEIKSPDINYLKRELKYASVDDVYGSGHLPDSLSALALAYKAAGVGYASGADLIAFL
jgi:hypothetical protein